MYVLEIFFKRRKFMTIFERAWKLIGASFSGSQQAAKSGDPQLELFHFAAVFYATVYQSALAAGMSTSSAHYLARIQTRKMKLEHVIVSAAEEVFAAPDDAKLEAYAARLTQCVEPIVSTLAKAEVAADETECSASLSELYRYFQQAEFSAEELFTAQP